MYLTIDSGNGKLVGKPRRGICASLALPIRQTCPPSCNVKDECYAQGGRMRIKVMRLEAAAGEMTPLQIARAAACEMTTAADQHWAEGRPLRLFEAGDARTTSAARVIAAAARYWLRRGGIAAWGYTHAWRRVPREAWAGVSMFASVETLRGAQDAIRRGYTPAIIVPKFPTTRAFEAGGVNWIPCPAQTSDGQIPCVRCRLCFDDQARAASGHGIAFAAHGAAEQRLRRRLPLLRDRDVGREERRRAMRHARVRDDLCFAPTIECGSVEWT